MERVDVAGLELDVEVYGRGPALLYLHPEQYLHLNAPFIAKLSAHWRVIVPHHPGFDGRTPPADFRSVGDIAYLYLDLLDAMGITAPLVVGSSFGGWIGLEMAVRNATKMRGMVLLTPLGAKLSTREDRDFADLFAMPLDDAQQCLFAGAPPNLATFDDATVTQYACDRQYAAYYAWKPYMHNPALARWLHRVTIPTHLLWGVSDRFVSPQYGERLAHLLPQSSLDVLDGAGHYPQLERTDEAVALVQRVDAQLAPGGTSQ